MDRKRAWKMKEKLFQPTFKCLAKLIEEVNTLFISSIRHPYLYLCHQLYQYHSKFATNAIFTLGYLL